MNKEIDFKTNFYLCSPLLNKQCSKESCYINNGACCHTVNKEYSQKHLLDYKSRNEKAIEYGNNCLENIEEYDEYICESIGIVSLLRMVHKNYIDILGGDKE